MNIELYIEDYLVDLSDKLDYTLNKSFIDYLNPTDIKTEFTKTIEIPFTPANNKLFGNIYRVDNQLKVSPTESVFQFFDPAKKLKCRLMLNSEVIFSGYCKMNSITNTAKKHSYNINIFGGLGLFFSELKKLIPSDDLIPEGEDPNEYKKYILNYISEAEIQRHPINRYLISDSFSNSKPVDLPTEGSTVPLLNRIGFAPVAGGFNPDFDSANIYSYKKWPHPDPNSKDPNNPDILFEDTEILSFEKLLTGGGVNADTAKYLVGDGLVPRAYGEYRSYYQKPYIFMNQYFWSICKKMESLTGKKIHLDPDWFNFNNPYFSKLVKVCKNLPLGKPDDKIYNFNINTVSNKNERISTFWPSTSSGELWNTVNYTGILGSESLLRKEKYIILPNDKITNINSSLPLQLNLTRNEDEVNPLPVGTKVNLQDGYYIEVEVITKIYPNDSAFFPGSKNEGKLLKTQTYWIIADPVTEKKRKKFKIPAGVIPVWIKNSTPYNGTELTMFFDLPITDLITFAQTNCLGSTSCIIFNQVLLALSYRFRFQKFPGANPKGNFAEAVKEGSVQAGKEHYMDIIISNRERYPIFEISNKTNCRSYSQLSLANFLQDETIYDSFINYIKIFNLIITEEKGDIYIRTFKTFFKNHKIIDVSEKLAREEDYKMTPVIFDQKYIKFNYEDVDTQVNEEYKKMTKFNYGELNIKTNYNFNNDTKDLFKDQFSFIPISPTLLDWNRIFDGTYRAGTPDEILGCYYKLNENKPEQVDYGNCYAFWNGKLKFDSDFREVYITDDIDYEIINNKYLYHLNDNPLDPDTGGFGILVEEYPLIDNHYNIRKRITPGEIGPLLIIEQKYSTFAVPKYKYTVGSNLINSPKQTDIYTQQFKRYFDEIYNLNNYKLECSLYITPYEFAAFNFNKFIKIDNVLFFVNKIIDYNPTLKRPTKVELLKVSNIKSYLQV